MFYFILHPLQWLIPDNANVVFKCQILEEGVYEVSWMEGGDVAESFYDREEVMEALAKGWWIMTDVQGEY